MHYLNHLKSILLKEFYQERQGKYILNSMLMFSLLLIAVVVFPFTKSDIETETKNVLYWVIIYFSATTGLSNTFLKEAQKQTIFHLKLIYNSYVLFLGKTIFNFIFLMFSVGIITLVYTELFSFDFGSYTSIFVVILLTVIGISFSGTMLSALISQVMSHGSLYVIVGFPVLFPVFLLGINATEFIVTTGAFPSDLVGFIVVYDIISISLSMLVFEIIWDAS